MKRFFVGLIMCSLFFPPYVFATHKLEIASDKTTLASDEEMTMTLTFSGFDMGEVVYVKGAFASEGSSNYFGLSKYGDAWIKNSASSTSQPQFHIEPTSVLLQLKSDPSDSGFHGEGDYQLKIGYYYTTSGGNVSSVNWSDNMIPIHLSAPAPASTPTPSPKHTTPTPTEVKKPADTPAVENTMFSNEEIKSDEKEGEEVLPSEIEVLGDSTYISPSLTPTAIPVQVKSAVEQRNTSLPIVFGLGMLSFCAILICRNLRNLKFPFEH